MDDAKVVRDEHNSRGRLGPCQVCKNEEVEAKYRCPRCSLCSCSLACSVQHKKQTGCSGKWDRARFVRRSGYDDTAFMSDYGLLEDANRAIDDAVHTRMESGPGVSGRKKRRMVQRKHALRAAAKRQGISLRMMPPTFQRRRENTSTVQKQQSNDKTRGPGKCILWRVEVFIDGRSVPVTVDGVADHVPLKELTERLLKHMPQLEVGDSKYFMKDEHRRTQNGGPGFWPLGNDTTLKEALRGKVIIEYPTLYLSKDTDKYRPPVPASPTAVANSDGSASDSDNDVDSGD